MTLQKSYIDKKFNNFFHKNVDFDLKKNKIYKQCWFCQKDCNNFVSICDSCKSDRFSKAKNI